MNKKLLTSIIFLALAGATCTTSWAIDLEKVVKQQKETLGKEITQTKESIKKKIKKVTGSLEKEITNKKESFFEKIHSWFSLEKITLYKLPLIYILLIAFVIGIATSFTPCIYPMIPITIGIMQSQASPSLTRNFLLATSYVTGMATVYAILGYIAATTTLILGQWLANPWIIGLLILLFIYIAFAMFGFYEIYTPR